MSIEHNMKLVQGLRRMGIMASEVPQLEALIAEGKKPAEIADIMICDVSVVEAFQPKPNKAGLAPAPVVIPDAKRK